MFSWLSTIWKIEKKKFKKFKKNSTRGNISHFRVGKKKLRSIQILNLFSVIFHHFESILKIVNPPLNYVMITTHFYNYNIMSHNVAYKQLQRKLCCKLFAVRIIHIIKRDQTNGNNDSNALAVLENLKNFQIQKL